MIIQRITYQCQGCGEEESYESKLHLGEPLTQTVMPKGWNAFGIYIYCPRHTITVVNKHTPGPTPPGNRTIREGSAK